MIIIADAGSTKIDWRIIDDNQEIQVLTKGFNPYYNDETLLDGLVEDVALKTDPEKVSIVNYYGTGCSSESSNKIVSRSIKKVFHNAICCVHHDLLASARAILKSNSGIACILGTGSNSCLYDGNQIIENVPSVGWMIGDEGSGTYIGKLLITDYMRYTMPEDIRTMIEEVYHSSFEDCLNAMYSQPNPGSFFSQFSHFISKNIDKEYCYNILNKNFDDFYKYQISKYTNFMNEEVGFVGSVAYVFREQLREWACKKNINIGTILKAPMDGLIEYHKAQ